MRALTLLAAAATLLTAAPGAAAQEAIRIAPKEAMQCALWASIFSEVVEDQEAKAALLYALSYFVGHYEGVTDRSIKDGHDEAALSEVVLDPEAFTEVCQGHMSRYGPRMVDWGNTLSALGERLAAEQTQQDR